ncbi:MULTISPECIES: acetoacetyl-CoA reductase [Rugamonas]|uniref:3-oxoacyl-[acyl-carrier-protein] reductase n=1 Tax=Rugamonas rubra TaxID=758825 RepID=A0A1I4PEM8_9BURK|nr:MULTISPECIES: acetoacetyl-CoA reductase [Rugamonas]WGG53213.1 acetoacetyl-CoA reductase [Rugamonas sp. DEMB1]SFM26120.1 3-oxoacyl-[acyl-carrier-protein] reductase [Rugamonas rubra]
MSRIALVTGGTRGLGQAVSLALQQAGHQVAAVYHSHDEEAHAFAAQSGIRVFQWDVADYAACRAGVARVSEELGAPDILVNNAGVTADAMLHKMTPEQWWLVIQTNLGSMFNMSQQVIEGMRQRGFGRIVNISSINGRKGQLGQCNYAAAKAGILGFTKALALEGARKNITVNAIAPGYCDTSMVAKVAPETLQAIIAGIPVGRLGTPAEIGRMVAFLVAEESGFITGATFDVNGGQYMA